MSTTMICVFLGFLVVILIMLINLFDKIDNIKKDLTEKQTIIPINSYGFENVFYLDDRPLDDQERYDIILAKAKARLDCIERNKNAIITGKSEQRGTDF
jgi:hypothetical protein